MNGKVFQTFCTLRCTCNIQSYVTMHLWKILRALWKFSWVYALNSEPLSNKCTLYKSDWCMIRQGGEELSQRKRLTWSSCSQSYYWEQENERILVLVTKICWIWCRQLVYTWSCQKIQSDGCNKGNIENKVLNQGCFPNSFSGRIKYITSSKGRKE